MPAPRTALRPLLGSIVDYAGLFPPAALTMREAMEQYAGYLRSTDRWLLGSFVLPLSRIEEFETELQEVQGKVGRRWSLSLVVGEDTHKRMEEIHAIRDRGEGRFEIGSFEVPPISSRRVPAVAKALSQDAPVFFEAPIDDHLDAVLRSVAAAGVCAKIRTGGVKALAFPDVLQVAHFIERCHHYLVPFKATAGLHHPMRGPQRLTFDKNSSEVWMHGFFNLSLGSALLDAGKITGAELIELLSESSAAAFEVRGKELRWRKRSASREEIERSRRSFLQSFGSCSFADPVAELAGHGLT